MVFVIGISDGMAELCRSCLLIGIILIADASELHDVSISIFVH